MSSSQSEWYNQFCVSQTQYLHSVAAELLSFRAGETTFNVYKATGAVSGGHIKGTSIYLSSL